MTKPTTSLIFLLISLLFIPNCYAKTCYVNTASTAGGNGTTNSTDPDDPNRAFATLNDWEGYEDGNALIEPMIVYCEGSDADTVRVNISGWTDNNATNTITITTTQANRHNGKWDTGKYRLEPSSEHAVTVKEDYVTFDGLQIKATSSNYGITTTTVVGASNEFNVSNCIIWSDGGSGIGISPFSPSIAKVWNCVIYGFSATFGAGIKVISGATADVYNCTVSNTVRGIWNQGSMTCVNTASFNNSAAGYDFKYCDSVTYCASDDTVAGTGNIDWDNGATDWANVFEDYSNSDFHLKNFTGTGAIKDQGTSDPGSGLFSDDIDGQNRPGIGSAVWDIGADEYSFGTTIHGATIYDAIIR